jgi:hypothetical protein
MISCLSASGHFLRPRTHQEEPMPVSVAEPTGIVWRPSTACANGAPANPKSRFTGIDAREEGIGEETMAPARDGSGAWQRGDLAILEAVRSRYGVMGEVPGRRSSRRRLWTHPGATTRPGHSAPKSANAMR